LQHEEARLNKTISDRIIAAQTHHTYLDMQPLYELRFDNVLAYHDVNGRLIAPVSKTGLAWHIDINGNEIYKHRFHRTFGFYCGLAAVEIDDEWFHINIKGVPFYEERYSFTGNFQEDICVVCDQNGSYFHIDILNRPLYKVRWQYCGDFREEVAVVQAQNGLSTHIDKHGKLIHHNWYYDLDVFHKGYARAKDSKGWHHINLLGEQIYPQRYYSIEPFYNGFSRCETHDGSLLIIDEHGNIVRQLRESTVDDFSELSSDIVGYWRTFTIATAVELKIFEHLPASLEALAIKVNAMPDMLIRLLNALKEINLVASLEGTWYATNRGEFLKANNQKSLASAALEYAGDLMERWKELPKVIKGNATESHVFNDVACNASRLTGHHKMLSSYALHDYESLIPTINIQPDDIVFDAAGGIGTLASLLQSHNPLAKVILGDLPQIIEASQFSNRIPFDLFKPWPISADKIILSRVLHDWSDERALHILQRAYKALNKNGRIYILEMLLNTDTSNGSLCDLHLLAVTRGKERNIDELKSLAKIAGLELTEQVFSKSLVSVVCFEKR